MLIPEHFDHLVIAVPNLLESVEQFEDVLGVRAIPGGSHVGLGTANALLGLEIADEGSEAVRDRADGDRIYLEILGPDPDQDPELSAPRLVGITEPTVQRWAIRPPGFDELVAAAAGTADSRGPAVDLGEVFDMSRQTPEGELLEWRLTRRTPLALGGIQPFLIDWKNSPHPSGQDMPVVRLERFFAATAEVEATRGVLDFLGALIRVESAEADSLHATLIGPGGTWTL